MDLTHEERALLTAYEAIIADGLQSFIEVGDSLLRIRDNRLYRASHLSFATYCKERWGFSDRYARMLIAAAETVDRVESVGTIVPVNEGQARPLTRLPAEEQPAAWQEAVALADGQPTARQVQEVVERRKEPKTGSDPVRGAPIVEPDQRPELAAIREAFRAIAQIACGELPDEWELKICLINGGLEIRLYDPDGDRLDSSDPIDARDAAGALLSLVSAARIEAGLGAVKCKGWKYPKP